MSAFSKRRSAGEIHHAADHWLAFLAIAAVSVPIFLRWARGDLQAAGAYDRHDRKWRAAIFGARTGLMKASDEIGRVALHLDGLLDQFQGRDRRLRQWNEELNTG